MVSHYLEKELLSTIAATTPWQAHGTSSLLILHDLCFNFSPVTLLAYISFQKTTTDISFA
jgi:hypothetical protein